MDRARELRFWVGVAAVVAFYLVRPAVDVARRASTTTPYLPPQGAVWKWEREDGTVGECRLTWLGDWVNEDHAPCDGLHPGHGPPTDGHRIP